MSIAAVITAAVAAACVILNVEATAITWTGYGGDHQWTNRINWAPDQVPTLNDDVTIASGTVEVTIDTGANSITMGTSFDKAANLTIFKSFFVGSGGLNVDGNGNLMINSGSASVTGQIQLGGSLYFQSGMISGQWSITTRGVADLSGPAEKVLSGCQMSVAGALTLSGVLVLNQSSTLTVSSAATLSGAVSVQAQDSSPVLFDTRSGKLTYAGGGEFQIQAPMKLGTFVFVGGNITLYDDISFAGMLTIPSGSYVGSVGTASVDLSPGISGTGVLTAAGKAVTLGASQFSGVVNALAGNVTFSADTTVAVARVAGGQVNAVGAVTVTSLSLTAGSLSGAVRATKAQLQSPGFGLNGVLTIDTELSSMGTSLIAFGANGGLVITSNATLKAGGPLTLTGAVGRTVRNDGTLMASAATTLQNINLSGSGSVSVTASLMLSAASLTQATVRLSGSGVLSGSATQIGSIGAVTAKPSVDAKIGAYRFTCPGQCANLRTVGTPSSDFTFRVGSS